MSRIDTNDTRPITIIARLIIGIVAAVLLPPFVILAVAPMVLFMVPVALCAIPFMLSAFAGEAREVAVPARQLAALEHAIT